MFSCSVIPNTFNPMDCSPPSSSVDGSLQVRILGRVAMLSSRGSSRIRVWACIFCVSCVGMWILTTSTAWEAQNSGRTRNKKRQTLRSHIPAQISNLRNKISTLWKHFFFFLFKIVLFLAVLGLCCCMQAVSSCREWGLPFIAEHRLQACGLSSCGTRA